MQKNNTELRKDEDIRSQEKEWQEYPSLWSFGCVAGDFNISCQTDKESPTLVSSTEECLL